MLDERPGADAVAAHDPRRQHVALSAAPLRRHPWQSSLVTVGLPLLIAIGGAVLGVLELRHAVEFDVAASQVADIQRRALALADEEATAIRRSDAGGAGDEPAQGMAPSRRMTLALADLSAATQAIGLSRGPKLVGNLDRLYAAATSGRDPIEAAGDARRSGASRRLVFLDRYRGADVQLRNVISGRIADETNEFGIRIVEIVLLFLMSTVICILGIAVAARRASAERAVADRTIAALRRRPLRPAPITKPVVSTGAVRLPAAPGCRFDAVVARGNGATVGGQQWTDAVRLADGRILISIGAVAGEASDSTVEIGIVRQIVRGIAQVHATPGLMLDVANRALRLERTDVSVTVWIGMLDLVTRTLIWASAGHRAAFFGCDGSIRQLSDATCPLGSQRGYGGSANAIELVDNSTLLLCNGNASASDADADRCIEQTRAAAARLAAGPWDSPATALSEELAATAPLDNLAILVARLDFAQAERCIRRLNFDVLDVSSARKARDAFIETLGQRGFGAVESLNAEIVFSELTGNVVRHAREAREIEIAIDCSGPQTVLHVFDRGPGFRHTSVMPSDLFAESGRGLFIVDALTDDFAVERRPNGGSHARAVLAGRPQRPHDADEMFVPADAFAG